MKKKNLLKIIALNERVEEEAATRHHILHFFGQKCYFYQGKVLVF